MQNVLLGQVHPDGRGGICVDFSNGLPLLYPRSYPGLGDIREGMFVVAVPTAEGIGMNLRCFDTQEEVERFTHEASVPAATSTAAGRFGHVEMLAILRSPKAQEILADPAAVELTVWEDKVADAAQAGPHFRPD